MATIHNPRLTVSTDPIQNHATLVATCDVALSEFEVSAIKLLQLQYSVECHVLNKDLQFEDTVMGYNPRTLAGSSRSERVEFATVTTMSDLHEHSSRRMSSWPNSS